jgi:hypothetical protein
MPKIHSPIPRPASGFTLVEALVASSLSIIIGSILYTILQMSNQLVGNGGLNTKVQMQYGIVVMQIGKSVRGANKVIENQTWPPASNAPALSTQTIYLFSTTGVQTGGYRINGTTLQELISGTWQNFVIGSSTVQVTAASNFSLSGDKAWVTLGVNVFSTYRALKDTVSSKQEAFECRN